MMVIEIFIAVFKQIIQKFFYKIFTCSPKLNYRKDVKLSDDENDVKPTSSSKSEKTSSWVHRNLQKIHRVHGSKASKYDPHERNPLFAGAEMSNLWELSTLADHFHPSAALFGQTLLEDQQVGILDDVHLLLCRLAR